MVDSRLPVELRYVPHVLQQEGFWFGFLIKYIDKDAAIPFGQGSLPVSNGDGKSPTCERNVVRSVRGHAVWRTRADQPSGC